MTNFERIKEFDKADLIDFLEGIKTHCAGSYCDGCPLEQVKDCNSPTSILRWLESKYYGAVMSRDTVKEPIYTIVRVKFDGNTEKTYDYKYISEKPVQIGDTVYVIAKDHTQHQVKVVNIFEIKESEAEYDYKVATQ